MWGPLLRATHQVDGKWPNIQDWNEPELFDRELLFRIYYVPIQYANEDAITSHLTTQFLFIVSNSIQIRSISSPRNATNLYKNITVELIYRSDFKKTIRYVKFDTITCRAGPIFDVVQCYRCLRFGHYANTCDEEIACGKCDGPHQTKHCTENYRQCANCVRMNDKFAANEDQAETKTDHCATFQSCPLRVAYANMCRSDIL